MLNKNFFKLYVLEFGADVLSIDSYSSVLYYNSCEVIVATDKKCTNHQHITHNKHLRSIKQKMSKQLL